MGGGFNFGRGAPEGALLPVAGKRARLKRGVLRYALLYLLSDRSRHGYDLIRACRSLGWGSPSPGSIYPLLAILESDGLLSSREDGGRRVYEITDVGRRTLREHPARLRDLMLHPSQETEPDNDSARLESSTRRLFDAISLLRSSSAPGTVARACDLLDATRRKIYALLALE
jgi:DNA-binding PadR family transcriptional regulator